MPEALKDVRITELDFEEVIREPGDDVFLFLYSAVLYCDQAIRS